MLIFTCSIDVFICTCSVDVLRTKSVLTIFGLFAGTPSSKWSTSEDTHAEDGPPRFRIYPEDRKSYECINCLARFSQKSTILRHARYFCGQGYRYKCPYCDTKGSCSSNIYKHVRSRHEGSEPYSIKLFGSDYQERA